MTQLEALKIAYDELSNVMPYEGENDDVFEAAQVIGKIIETKERQIRKKQLKTMPKGRAERQRMREINDMFDDLLNEI